ncbi:hypothetical protein QM565_25485 [Geitlerinema splendidum]|nr:hypothetical protein [Geitlerinema splendidum]
MAFGGEIGYCDRLTGYHRFYVNLGVPEFWQEGCIYQLQGES